MYRSKTHGVWVVIRIMEKSKCRGRDQARWWGGQAAALLGAMVKVKVKGCLAHVAPEQTLKGGETGPGEHLVPPPSDQRGSCDICRMLQATGLRTGESGIVTKIYVTPKTLFLMNHAHRFQI